MKAQSGYIGTDDVRVDRGHYHRTIFLRVRACVGVRHPGQARNAPHQLLLAVGDATG
jgi:hypothetical protein